MWGMTLGMSLHSQGLPVDRAHMCLEHPYPTVTGPSYTHKTYVRDMTQGMHLHSDIGYVSKA